ncbi:ABC transporter ATP-binding protein [Oribacterium parvum]|uniref:ABC transporter ATP-binding protein n=1 Tax=Oribacterium parvum TaxID=1501329 RepID=UPI0028DBBE5E|nr:ABC transporter ATP-binding protein [Oribacterium parvum]
MKEEILRGEGIKKDFPIRNFFGKKLGNIAAVNDVNICLNKGETFGLVGESGCGKSTLGRCLLGMIDRTAGKLYFHGREIPMGEEKSIREMQRKMQIIFQDPYSSLNPYWTVREILEEPLSEERLSKKEKEEKIEKILEKVSLAKTDLLKTPYAFSGGQRQRIGIARALVKEPELVLCDEPIAALDVSIQAQVVNLLKDLQEELKLSYLFTAHDLSMVRYISDRIGVMYLGTIVETGDTDKVFQSALHPYTKALLAAVPRLSKVAKKEDILEGEAESIGTERGCLFASRCPYRSAQCLEARPVLESATEGHQVACFRWKEING